MSGHRFTSDEVTALNRARAVPFDDMYIPEPNSGCWLWLGAVASSFGHGWVHDPEIGGPTLAHRLSWKRSNGPIPKGLCVLHKCDVPSCVNPNHLFLGTRADNIADMIKKGRANLGGKKRRTK